MAEVVLAGQAVDTRLIYAGAAALGLILLLRRQSAPSDAALLAAANASNRADTLEFARLSVAANRDLAQISSGRDVELARIQATSRREAGTSPGALRTCIPWGQYYALDGATRGRLLAQARQGSVLLQPSASGMCVTPTTRGVAGHEPPRTIRRRAGLFSSSETTRGVGVSPGAGGLMEPGLISFLRALLPFLEPEATGRPRNGDILSVQEPEWALGNLFLT